MRVLMWFYRPVIGWVPRWRKLTIAAAAIVLARDRVSGHAPGQRVHAD